MKRLLLACVVAVGWICQALAQPAGPARQQAFMAPVEQSLQQLLNSGYAILAMGTGLSFTLRQGNIWVVCSVRTASEAAFFGQRNATVESKCHRLN